jgi:hypothetical protein
MSEEGRVLVGEFQKNSVETVKVFLEDGLAGFYAEIRVWATPRAGDEAGLHPTGRGFELAVELLPELRKLIDRALATAEFQSEERG